MYVTKEPTPLNEECVRKCLFWEKFSATNIYCPSSYTRPSNSTNKIQWSSARLLNFTKINKEVKLEFCMLFDAKADPRLRFFSYLGFSGSTNVKRRAAVLLHELESDFLGLNYYYYFSFALNIFLKRENCHPQVSQHLDMKAYAFDMISITNCEIGKYEYGY